MMNVLTRTMLIAPPSCLHIVSLMHGNINVNKHLIILVYWLRYSSLDMVSVYWDDLPQYSSLRIETNQIVFNYQLEMLCFADR